MHLTEQISPVEHSDERQVILFILSVADANNLLKTLEQNGEYQQREEHGPKIYDETKPSN